MQKGLFSESLLKFLVAFFQKGDKEKNNMKVHSPYDCKEVTNVQAFRLLPPSLQHYIRTVQHKIQAEIDEKNAGRFLPTSGFRSETPNRKYNGTIESLHRLGVARDFVPVNGLFDDPPVVDSAWFLVRRSPRCWHVEYIG